MDKTLLTKIHKIIAHPHEAVLDHDEHRAIAILMILQDHLTTDAMIFTDDLYGELNKDDRKKVIEILNHT